MSVGHIFLLLAAVLFFLLCVGMSLFPGARDCGFFLLALGLLLAGYRLPTGQQSG
jgi:hypothetical protein